MNQPLAFPPAGSSRRDAILNAVQPFSSCTEVRHILVVGLTPPPRPKGDTPGSRSSGLLEDLAEEETQMDQFPARKARSLREPAFPGWRIALSPPLDPPPHTSHT
jgi:hypothetical protein